MLGEPVEINAQFARLAHTDIEVEDTAVATIRFQSGALGVLHATTAAYPGLTARLQVMGDQGSAVIEQDRLIYFHERSRSDGEVGQLGLYGGGNQRDEVADPTVEVVRLDPTQSPLGHMRQYADLFDAIQNHRTPLVTVHDAMTSLAVVHGVYVSATLGRPVAFTDVLGDAFSDVTYEIEEQPRR
jgi:predicted dehydrogenase